MYPEPLPTPIGDLKDHPRNYREHPEDQLDHIVKSIETNGFYRNIVSARDWTILAGHGVVKAARKMGLETVPVIRLDLDPDEPRALKILAGDNEIGHLGVIDDRELTALLKEVLDVDVDGLLGTGYDEMMLTNRVFMTRAEEEIQDMSQAAAWAGMPEYDESGGKQLRVVVSFSSEEDRLEFVKLIGTEKATSYCVKGKVWTYRWPLRDHVDDWASVKFKADPVEGDE